MHITSAARLRLVLHTTTTKLRIDKWKHNNSWLTTLPFDVQWIDGTHQIFKWTNRPSSWLTLFTLSNMVHSNAFQISIKQQHNKILLTLQSQIFAVTTFNMNVTDYWLMARKFLIWNTTRASLQFWTADLNQVTLSIATEEVYSTFFYSTSTYTLHQLAALWPHWMQLLNNN